MSNVCESKRGKSRPRHASRAEKISFGEELGQSLGEESCLAEGIETSYLIHWRLRRLGFSREHAVIIGHLFVRAVVEN